MALPEGFVLETPDNTQPANLPEGFVVSEPTFEERLSDPEERKRIVDLGARKYANDTLNSANKAKNPFERFMRGAAQNMGAEFVGAGTAAFGIGDAVMRKKFKKENPWMTDEDATEAMKAYRDEVFKTKPLAAFTGGAAGVYLGAKGIGAGANLGTKALGAIPGGAGISSALSSALQLSAKGAPVANAARLAGTGLASGAATTAISEGRAPNAVEAAVMAAAGPVMGGAGRVATSAAKPILSRIFPNKFAAQELSKRTGNDLRQRVTDYEMNMTDGVTTPSLAEVALPSEQQALGQFVAKAPESADVLARGVREGGERVRSGIQSDFNKIGAGQGASTTTKARDEALTAVMDNLRTEDVTITPQMISVLRDNGGLAGATPAMINRMKRGAISVNDLDYLRQNASNPAGAQAIEGIVTSQYADYGPAIRAFAEQSGRAEGAAAGASGVMRNITPQTFADAVPANSFDPGRAALQAQGYREGAIDAVQGAALENAPAVGKSMSEGGLGQRLSEVADPRVVSDAGRAIQTRAEGLGNLAGFAKRGAMTEDQQARNLINDAVTGITGLVAPLGGAAKAGLANRMALGISLPNKVRTKVAEMMLDADPAKVSEALDILEASGHSRQQVLNMYQDLAAFMGVTAGLPGGVTAASEADGVQ